MQDIRESRVSRRKSRDSSMQEDGLEQPSRVQTSCWACRKSKVRCDRQYPCGRCGRLQKSCVMQTRGRGRPTKEDGGGEGFNSEKDGNESIDGEDYLHCGAINKLYEEDVLLQQQQQQQQEKQMRVLGRKGRTGGGGEQRPEEEEEEQDKSRPPQHGAAAAFDPTDMMNVCEEADEPTSCHHHQHHLDNQQQPALGSSGYCDLLSNVGAKGPGTEGEKGYGDSVDEPAGPPSIFDKDRSLSDDWTDVGLSGLVEWDTGYIDDYASKDGGPAPWQMTGGLRPPIGIQYHEHCRAAAAIFGEEAHRVFQQGMLQHRKALAVIRTWDVYSYRHGVDIACGASEAILRVLTMPIPEDSIVAPQEEIPSDPSLTTRATEELLNPACMPPYVAQLKVNNQSAATCGYVYANGHYRLWVNDKFSIRFFTTEEANARFTQMSILPCYIYGNMMNPKDRPSFYSRLMEYLLTRTDETQEMSMVLEMVERNRRIHNCLVRVRYTIMNDGQYACLAFSIQRLHNGVEEIVRDEEEEFVGPPLHQRPVMKYHDTSSLLSYSSSSCSSCSSSSSSLPFSYTTIPFYISEPSSAAIRVSTPQLSLPLPHFYDTNHHQQQQHPKYAISHHQVAAAPPSWCPLPSPPPPPPPFHLSHHHQHPHHLVRRPLDPLSLSSLHRQHHPHQQTQQQQQNPPQQQYISQHQHWIQPRQYLVPSSATYPPAGGQPA